MNRGNEGTFGDRLLPVDDVTPNVHLPREAPSGLGHRLPVATDGEAAITAARTHRPGLLLLDVMVPGMTGCQVV